MNYSAPAPVKSAMRTMDVIEFVVAHQQGVVAKDIASGLCIPLSSLSYLLATLTEREYLQRDGRRYLPGPGLARLLAPRETLTLEQRLAPIIRSITAELNETASFMVRDGWDARIVVTEASAQALRYAIEPGERRPLHCLAGGKAILAGMSAKELDQYFAQSHRERLTDKTVFGEAELRAQLRDVVVGGFATALEESTPGISSIALAVTLAGKPVGAIGVAVPTLRFTDELQAAAQSALQRAASALH